MSNVRELEASIREHLGPIVQAGMLEQSIADQVAENITAIALLHERGLITQRLADHLIDKLGLIAGNEQLSRFGAPTVGVV